LQGIGYFIFLNLNKCLRSKVQVEHNFMRAARNEINREAKIISN
jgi:hypothetical protein